MLLSSILDDVIAGLFEIVVTTPEKSWALDDTLLIQASREVLQVFVDLGGQEVVKLVALTTRPCVVTTMTSSNGTPRRSSAATRRDAQSRRA